MVLWRRDRSSGGGGDAGRVRSWRKGEWRERERERKNKHSKLEKLEQLEKLEKPERECHVSMETWWGNSASGLVGSISSRLLPCSNVNVFHIFPTRPRRAFSPLVQPTQAEKEREKSHRWRSGDLKKTSFFHRDASILSSRVPPGPSPPTTFALITQFPFLPTLRPSHVGYLTE